MEYPSSISDYALAFDILFDSVVVFCKFCSNPLNYFDLCNFDAKNFRLIWRDLKVYGVCCTCARTSAAFEANSFYSCSYLAKELLRDSVLSETIIRCLCCLGLLSYSEKLGLVANHSLVHRVRNGWRAVCKFCEGKK
ncbi:E6 early protein [Bos taurus papillomavirus 40]|nr:E6 early protein [Bos taurus papillomavirus 40]